MAKYPPVQTPGRLKKFLTEIKSAGTPKKVSIKWLESLGFKSKNDRLFLQVLDALGFTSNGSPTERYKRFRSKATAPSVLASALKEAYKELYSTFPNAQMKDSKALEDWFASNTSVSEITRQRMVNTFQTLADLANFKGEIPPDLGEEVKRPKGKGAAAIGRSVTLNLNIQLQLPATHDQEIYEKLFAAMGKYLLGSES